jgi:Core-2/I-Branching enzyme
MTTTIGFVLLTHNNPQQALRLVNILNSMFDRPPIAWHHDFTLSPLPFESITKNISLVCPHIRTGWAKFSLIDATIMALDLLFKAPDPPDWFVLLSGSDYPIKSANTIIHDLSRSEFDVHMHHEKITFNSYERDWQRLCYDRYCATLVRLPAINRRLRPIWRTITLRHPVFLRRETPFSSDLSCFAGEHWFSANRPAAEYLIEYHRTKTALSNHYRARDVYTVVPEESYYHTILCNAPFRISQNNWRYIDWSHNSGAAHPKTLTIEDLPKMRESTAHFARKFHADTDQVILDALDERILR